MPVAVEFAESVQYDQITRRTSFGGSNRCMMDLRPEIPMAQAYDSLLKPPGSRQPRRCYFESPFRAKKRLEGARLNPYPILKSRGFADAV